MQKQSKLQSKKYVLTILSFYSQFIHRNLPQIGHKGWQGHFEAAFNAYTRLWRFQQQYRHILDSKYDLKRWQIGEIASKIGQLYYHY